MAKKKTFKDLSDLVYSTNPESVPQEEEHLEPALEPEEQHLVLYADKKHRKGKIVVIIEGFQGHPDDIKDFAKEIKQYCGVGGSVKDEQIIIQSKEIEKIANYLIKEGYNVKLRN